MKDLTKKEVETLLQRINGVDDSTPPQEIDGIIISWFNQEWDNDIQERKHSYFVWQKETFWPNWERDYSSAILFQKQNYSGDYDLSQEISKKVFALCKCKNLTKQSVEVLFFNALARYEYRLDVVEHLIKNHYHSCQRMIEGLNNSQPDARDSSIHILGFAGYDRNDEINDDDRDPLCGLCCLGLKENDYFHLMEVIEDMKNK